MASRKWLIVIGKNRDKHKGLGRKHYAQHRV